MKAMKKWLPAVPVLFLLTILTWFIVLKQMGTAGNDMVVHTVWAVQLPFFEKLLSVVSYPMYHIGIRLMSKVLPFQIPTDVALFFSLTNIAIYGILYYLWDSTLKSKPGFHQGWLAAMVFILLIVQPIYIPAFNPNLYVGQGSINIWHNPTYMLVKPFAILAFVLVCRMISADRMEEKLIFTAEWWKLLVLMIFCNLAKPSFSQVFIPGLGLYMVIDIVRTHGKAFLYHLQVAAAFIPGTIILFAQTFASLGEGIAVSWMQVWSRWSKSPLISILLLMAFPVCILCIEHKAIFKDIVVKLSFCVFLAGFLEAALLVEKGGERWTHGNFFWGYYLSALVVWLAVFPHFLQMHFRWREERTGGIKLMLSWVILLLHFVSGCWYLCNILVQL